MKDYWHAHSKLNGEINILFIDAEESKHIKSIYKRSNHMLDAKYKKPETDKYMKDFSLTSNKERKCMYALLL